MVRSRGYDRGRSRLLVASVCLLAGASACAEDAAAAAPSAPDAAAAAPDGGGAPYRSLSLEQLMSIEVTTVSRRPEPLAQAASSIQVVTQDDIRRSGASSLPQALRLAPNLEVAQVSASGWAISARGFNNTIANKMLVMIDGRTVYTPLFAGVFWDVQDVFLADVDRIEVVSGPGATLWGSNAVNGVINVVSKDARETQGLYLEGGGGSELNAFGGVRYGGALSPDLHYRVSSSYFSLDDSRQPDGHASDDGQVMGQVGFRLDWEPTATALVTLQGDLYDGAVEQPTADPATVAGGNVLGRWTQRLDDRSELRLQTYYDRTDRSIPASITEHLDTVDLDCQHRFPVGRRNDVTWGLGYRVIADRVENPPSFAFLPEDVTRNWYTGFVQDEIAVIRDHLTLTLGSKIERNDYTGIEVEPSARVALRPTAQQTVWAAVSRAVRTPSRIDVDFFAPRDPPFTTLQGGPDFESETLWAYELGYRAQPEDWLSASLSLFYDDYDDLRSTQQVAPPAATPVVIANGFAGSTYGAEAAIDARVAPWWRLRPAWTELRTDLHAERGSTDPSQASGEANDPKRFASLRSSFDLGAGWELDAMYRYVDRIATQDVPGYSEVDVRLGWLARRDLELSLVGQNLLHDRHAEFGAAATRSEIERSAYGKIAWRF